LFFVDVDFLFFIVEAFNNNLFFLVLEALVKRKLRVFVLCVYPERVGILIQEVGGRRLEIRQVELGSVAFILEVTSEVGC
jgi:hypothetical protein